MSLFSVLQYSFKDENAALKALGIKVLAVQYILYICTCTHTKMYIHSFVYVHTNTRMYICKYICVRMYAYKSVHVFICVCTYLFKKVHTFFRICTYVHI